MYMCIGPVVVYSKETGNHSPPVANCTLNKERKMVASRYSAVYFTY